MSQSFLSSTQQKRKKALTLSNPFPALVQHKCRIGVGLYCIDYAEPIGFSEIDGPLAKCPHCNRVLAISERDAVKL